MWPQMNQVISNLLINAKHAMPKGGTVWISAENCQIREGSGLPLPEGSYVHIAVRDEGVGIKAEYLDRIFDPYFTTKTRTSEKGTGLGLAIVYSVMKRHGGCVTVESKEGKGAVFHLYLPAADHMAPKVQEDPKPLHTGRGRILVMDDEESVRNIVQEMLTHLGYETDVATDGQEAVQKYERALRQGRPYAAAILDLTVRGGMGAKETLERIRALDPAVKAIVSSGYIQDDIVDRYSDYGFAGVVTKPFTIRKLAETLQRVVPHGERRRRERKRVDQEVIVESNRGSFPARAKNLSEDGLLIGCGVPMEADEPVCLSVKAGEEHARRLKGRVVWCRVDGSNGHGGSHLVGIHLESVTEEDREFVRRLLEEDS